MSVKLTAEDIHNMEARRGIDALIASHIFKLIWWRRGQSGQWIALPEHDTEIPDYWIQDTPPLELTEDDLSEAVPHYSTDIAAAWRVVEKLESKNIARLELTRLGWDWHRTWRATFFTTALNEGQEAKAETAPLAICRAALLATMESNP